MAKRELRFFVHSTPSPYFASAVALLLLLPTLSALSPRALAGATTQAQGAPAQTPPPSTPSAFSSYRSLGPADPSMPVIVSVAIPLRNLALLSSIVKESSDPSSSGFRHFLTYADASQTFLPTQGQYLSVL